MSSVSASSWSSGNSSTEQICSRKKVNCLGVLYVFALAPRVWTVSELGLALPYRPALTLRTNRMSFQVRKRACCLRQLRELEFSDQRVASLFRFLPDLQVSRRGAGSLSKTQARHVGPVLQRFGKDLVLRFLVQILSVFDEVGQCELPPFTFSYITLSAVPIIVVVRHTAPWLLHLPDCCLIELSSLR